MLGAGTSGPAEKRRGLHWSTLGLWSGPHSDFPALLEVLWPAKYSFINSFLA